MQSALWRLDASPAVSDHPEVRFRLHEAQPGSKYTRSAVFDRSSFSVSLVGLHTGQLKKNNFVRRADVGTVAPPDVKREVHKLRMLS